MESTNKEDHANNKQFRLREQKQQRKVDNICERHQIVQDKLICYVSSFHLNINDWVIEYENIEIFNSNLKSALGSGWTKQIGKSIQDPSIANIRSHGQNSFSIIGFMGEYQNEDSEQALESSQSDENDKYFQLLLNLFLMTFYQATNIAEAYVTQKHLQASKIFMTHFNQDHSFELFFNHAVNFIQGKGYVIFDFNIFQESSKIFYYNAQNEYEKILRKIEQDQHSKIQFTEKALKEFDEIQRNQSYYYKDQQSQEYFEFQDDSNVKHQKLKEDYFKNHRNWEKKFLGINLEKINRMGTSIPGFQLIKDRVIKPLLVATERIVEYYMPNDQPQIQNIKFENNEQNLEDELMGENLQNQDEEKGKLYNNLNKIDLTTQQESNPNQQISSITKSILSNNSFDQNQIINNINKQQVTKTQSSNEKLYSQKNQLNQNVENLQFKFENLNLLSQNYNDILSQEKSPKSFNSFKSVKSKDSFAARSSSFSVSQSSQSSQKLLKKRIFKELESWDCQQQQNSSQKFKQNSGCHKKRENQRSNSSDDKLQAMDIQNDMQKSKIKNQIQQQNIKNLKFNQRLLQKASAVVDLISHKIEFKNQMNQTVTGKFVTVVLELTHDFIDQLEKKEQEIIQKQVLIATSSNGQSPSNLNIKFIKPSPHFYNKIMSLWFKFNVIQVQHLGSKNESNSLANMLEPQIKAHFKDFCIGQFRQVGSWNENLIAPLDNFITIVVKQYCKLQQQNQAKNQNHDLNDDKSQDEILRQEKGSSDESDELNLKSILQQFQKVAQMSGLNNVLFSGKKNEKNDQNVQQKKAQIERKKYEQKKENENNQVSMYALFDNIKQQLLLQWEIEIVQKGYKFKSQKQEILL